MRKIKMQLFGSFSLTYEGRVLGEETLHSNKLTRLLVYILLNRDYVLTHQQLLDVLGEETSQKPEGVLKNLMYRMRKAMSELGDDKFICTITGAYKWNTNIEVETDYEQFEALVDLLRKTSAREQKKEICRKIIASYKNNVSAKVAQETWMLPKVTWYQSGYMEAIHTLCELLEEEKDWCELELNCNRAMLADPFDEDVHCWLLRSLHGQKKFDQAIAQYEKAKKTFYENMGINSPQKLQEAFHNMLSDIGEDISDVDNLLMEMRELERQEGAFICDYHIFRQIYRIEARRIDRFGIAEHLMLLTLYRKGVRSSDKAVDYARNEGMDALEEAIRMCLRAGDVAARYSPTQFVVLLPMCTYESGLMVAERINQYFRKLIGKKRMEIRWELAELSSEI